MSEGRADGSDAVAGSAGGGSAGIGGAGEGSAGIVRAAIGGGGAGGNGAVAGSAGGGLRRRVAATWSMGDLGHRGAILVGGTIAAALAGAFLFGAWHVLVGYFVNGNPRAGLFGLALATVAGTLLVAVLAIARRRLPPA